MKGSSVLLRTDRYKVSDGRSESALVTITGSSATTGPSPAELSWRAWWAVGSRG